MPRPVTEEELLKAVDRLGASSGYVRRYGDMGFGRAQQILRDATAELMALRAQHSELVCPRCMTVHFRINDLPHEKLFIQTCPTCNAVLRPHAMAMEAALRNQIEALMERNERLEWALEQMADLRLDSQGEDADEGEDLGSQRG